MSAEAVLLSPEKGDMLELVIVHRVTVNAAQAFWICKNLKMTQLTCMCASGCCSAQMQSTAHESSNVLQRSGRLSYLHKHDFGPCSSKCLAAAA